ncbi:MAG TPA: DegT/DnrJ/EryC1/StrS family aminotransferase [Solirubrobacterales bacterium]|nr:DegT/DnrJ/EryC1/StrS family aminotransferase [Solirubrobacterales bacterium]
MSADPVGSLPLAQPEIGEREEQLVLEALRSGRLSLGPMLERFETAFAEWLGAAEAVAVASGTAALHLGVRSLGWSRGDAVITSPLSFVASVNCLLYEGVRPVFCDVDPVTFNLDPDAAAAAIDGETAGLLPVDIFGYPAAIGRFGELADRHDIGLLEDACEALGARDAEGRLLGAGRHPATFAFYANKQLTTGEGGMITFSDPDLAARARSERNQGRAADMGWLDHERLGYNYRLPELACALGIAQLERLDRLLADRERVAGLYAERLAGLEEVQLLPSSRGAERRSWFVYVIALVDSDSDGTAERRDAVIAALAKTGVPAKAYMPCLHRLDHLREYGFRAGQFPVAEAISARTLALPFFPQMTEAQVDRVGAALETALGPAEAR